MFLGALDSFNLIRGVRPSSISAAILILVFVHDILRSRLSRTLFDCPHGWFPVVRYYTIVFKLYCWVLCIEVMELFPYLKTGIVAEPLDPIGRSPFSPLMKFTQGRNVFCFYTTLR